MPLRVAQCLRTFGIKVLYDLKFLMPFSRAKVDRVYLKYTYEGILHTKTSVQEQLERQLISDHLSRELGDRPSKEELLQQGTILIYLAQHFVSSH